MNSLAGTYIRGTIVVVIFSLLSIFVVAGCGNTQSIDGREVSDADGAVSEACARPYAAERNALVDRVNSFNASNNTEKLTALNKDLSVFLAKNQDYKCRGRTWSSAGFQEVVITNSTLVEAYDSIQQILARRQKPTS